MTWTPRVPRHSRSRDPGRDAGHGQGRRPAAPRERRGGGPNGHRDQPRTRTGRAGRRSADDGPCRGNVYMRLRLGSAGRTSLDCLTGSATVSTARSPIRRRAICPWPTAVTEAATRSSPAAPPGSRGDAAVTPKSSRGSTASVLPRPRVRRLRHHGAPPTIPASTRAGRRHAHRRHARRDAVRRDARGPTTRRCSTTRSFAGRDRRSAADGKDRARRRRRGGGLQIVKLEGRWQRHFNDPRRHDRQR